MKLYTFFVPEHIQPGRLLPVVRRMLPDVPEYVLREAFQKRDVKVEGKRVGMDAMLSPGTEVRIYAREVQPKTVIILMGFVERLVIPFMARLSILLKG